MFPPSCLGYTLAIPAAPNIAITIIIALVDRGAALTGTYVGVAGWLVCEVCAVAVLLGEELASSPDPAVAVVVVVMSFVTVVVRVVGTVMVDVRPIPVVVEMMDSVVVNVLTVMRVLVASVVWVGVAVPDVAEVVAEVMVVVLGAGSSLSVEI